MVGKKVFFPPPCTSVMDRIYMCNFWGDKPPDYVLNWNTPRRTNEIVVSLTETTESEIVYMQNTIGIIVCIQ